jgi:hypothetical protein
MREQEKHRLAFLVVIQSGFSAFCLATVLICALILSRRGAPSS